MASPAGRDVTLRASGLMASAILLSRLLGMLRDTVMVAQFSIGRETDAYQLALLIPDMIFMLVAGGGLSSAFIPVFSEYWHKDKKEDAWKLFSSVVWLSGLACLCLIALSWAYAPWIVDFFRDKKPADILPPAVSMARIVLPAQFAFIVGSVLLATLYARMRFIGPALAPNVYNVGIILGGLVGPTLFHAGIESMAWGALIGAIVGNLVLPALLMAKAGSKFHFKVDVRHPGVKQFFVLFLPVLFGFSLPSMSNLITQKFASMYGADGVNTVLRYANNLMQAPLGIFGQSLALAAFPALAEFVAKERMDLYREQMGKTLRTALFLGVPSGFLLLAFATPVVHVLYGYGKAIDAQQGLEGIADCLRIYSVGIFAWCMQPVLMRGFFSLQKTLQPILLSTLMTLVFIGLSVAVVKSGSPYPWLAWASNIAATLLAVVLLVSLEGSVGKLDRMGLLSTLVKSTVASAAAAAVGWGAFRLVPASSRLVEIVALFVIGLISCAVFYQAARLMKMPEVQYLDRALARLDRKKGKTAGR